VIIERIAGAVVKIISGKECNPKQEYSMALLLKSELN
jgi:hypothetical protein